jgi:lipid-binding SYLF domain-containing protein
MTRLILACSLAFMLAAVPFAARAQTEQQTLVDRSTLAIQDMLSDPPESDARNLLKRSKGVMVCPRVFKAGFIFGGQGGSCVMVGRLATGWTGPAFYGMGAGSFGLQIGIQDSEIMFIILTEKGLHALLDSQFKIGADMGVAIATLGAGVSGSTTAAFNADIVAFARSRGLYAGVSLDGSMIGSRSEWNLAYYGKPLAAQQIVLQGEGSNPGAEPLREMLARFAGA